LNINRLLGSNNTNNKITVITAIFSLLFIITAVFFPFEQSQATSAQLQKNNSNYFSLSVLSTVSGTGAAATGIIVTVPGVLRTRNQSKCLSTYLLKIHRKYDELGKRTESVDKEEYLDFLEGLRSDIIYLLHRREINEYQYKMLDDRIIEHLNKINTRMNYPSR
jgi:preprotein translocase subunit SecG